MNQSRGAWYLLTGLVVGLLLSVAIAWLVPPPAFIEPKVSPAALQPVFRDQYRAMIAAAYLADGDLVRARARLDLLGDPDLYRALAEQAQRTPGSAAAEAHSLGILASALSAGGQPASPTPFATFVFTPTVGIATQQP